MGLLTMAILTLALLTMATLTYGRLLQEQHGMAHAQLARAVHTMRRRGVRRENVRLNT